MSIVTYSTLLLTQPDEILIIIMSYIDLDSIFRLGLCAQKFSLLVVDKRLWECKLSSDYGIATYSLMSCRKSYQWYMKVSSVSDQILKALVDKENQLNSEIISDFNKCLIKAGPTMSIEIVCTVLDDCGWIISNDLKEHILNTINKVKNEKELEYWF
jgi:hypothetical protein